MCFITHQVQHQEGVCSWVCVPPLGCQLGSQARRRFNFVVKSSLQSFELSPKCFDISSVIYDLILHHLVLVME